MYNENDIMAELKMLRKDFEHSKTFDVAKPAAGWLNWTPTVTASGSMTIADLVVNSARYTKIGNIIYFNANCSFTTGGTASTIVYFTLPITAASAYNTFTALVGDPSGITGSAFSSTTLAGVRRYDSANWSLGASRYFIVSGFYEIE